jgi:hypothetical protein
VCGEKVKNSGEICSEKVKTVVKKINSSGQLAIGRIMLSDMQTVMQIGQHFFMFSSFPDPVAFMVEGCLCFELKIKCKHQSMI